MTVDQSEMGGKSLAKSTRQHVLGSPRPFCGPYRMVTASNRLQVVVGIAVTVVYQGNFEAEGYRLGRLAAGLYRVPPKVDNGATSRGGNELPQVLGAAWEYGGVWSA